MESISPKRDDKPTKRMRTVEEFRAHQEKIKKKAAIMRSKKQAKRNLIKPSVENMEDRYFTTPEQLLSEPNYIMLIGPIVSKSDSMKYWNEGTVIVYDAPTRMGELPYMKKPAFF